MHLRHIRFVVFIVHSSMVPQLGGGGGGAGGFHYDKKQQGKSLLWEWCCFIFIECCTNCTLERWDNLSLRAFRRYPEPEFWIKELRKRFPWIDSASLCSLAGRYDNPIPARFLASIDCSRIPAQGCAKCACTQVCRIYFATLPENTFYIVHCTFCIVHARNRITNSYRGGWNF